MISLQTGLKGPSLGKYALLHTLFLLYSAYAVLCKLAAQNPVFSQPFMLLYGCALLALALYALFWQRILKIFPLSVAFSNKAVTVIWGMLWGAALFREEITIPKLIGSALVIAGILLVANDDK